MRAFDAKWLEISVDFLMCADNRRTDREHAKKEIQRFGWTKTDSFDKLQDAAQESVDAEVRERAEEREAERQEWVRQKQLAEAAAASVKAGISKKRGRNKKHNSVEERTAARRKQQADYTSRKRQRAALQSTLRAVEEHLSAGEAGSEELNSELGTSSDDDAPVRLQYN